MLSPVRPSRRLYPRFALCWLLTLLLCSPTPTLAAAKIRIETQETQTSNGTRAAALVVNGEVVASIAKENGGRNPVRIVSSAANQLSAAYRSGRFELSAQATDDSGRRWVLFLNSRALLVASDAEAKAWGVEPRALAQTWQRKLNAALAASPAPLAPDPGAPAPPPSTPQPAQPPAQPIQPGERVQPARNLPPSPAAATQLERVPQLPAGAIVTGSRPGPDIVNAAIDAALRFEQRIPGTAPLLWKLAGSSPKAIALKPGQSSQAQVEFTAAGAPSATALDVYNSQLNLPRESLTLFSNSPESVYNPQLLYEAELPAGVAARLVYHHQCHVKPGLRCVVRVLSPAGMGALHVIPGTAKADINTFYVGFKSAESFWHNVIGGNGYAAPLADGGQLVLLSQQLDYGYTASGYMKLTNLGTTPLRVEVLALPGGDRLPAGAIRPSATTTRSVFDSPYLAETVAFAAGSPWLYLRLGAGRPQSTTDDAVLHGCYGMTHNYTVELSNPGSAPALVFIVLRASAGEVKGQFYINGEYVVTPLVASGEELLLRELPMPPGAAQRVNIQAIALNGGFYPASVIFRETRYP